MEQLRFCDLRYTESVATPPPFGPIEGQKWFDQISSQWESQKNRFTLIYFGTIQFLPPCIWNITFMSYRLGLDNLYIKKIICMYSSAIYVLYTIEFWFFLYLTVFHPINMMSTHTNKLLSRTSHTVFFGVFYLSALELTVKKTCVFIILYCTYRPRFKMWSFLVGLGAA